MADRDKLIETIATAIGVEMGDLEFDWSNHLKSAEAALTVIESSGYVIMPKDEILRKMSTEEFTEMMAGIPFRENDLGCQASPGIKGDTVSREGALQASILRMGEEGQLTGAKDRLGREIRIGDTLRFDYDEWNRGTRSGEQEDCIFIMEYEDGKLVHPGSYSDLAAWCEIIEANSQSQIEEAQRADTEGAADAEASLTHKPLPPSSDIEGE